VSHRPIAAGVPDATRPSAPEAEPPAAAAGLTADALLAATGGTLLRAGSRPARRGSVDSRIVEPGMLFVALRGEHTDGHRFLADAATAGAAALIVGRVPDETAGEAPLDALGDVTVVLVPDPLLALHAVAAAWRRRFAPLVVGVTGSIAKTSTKEAVAAVLAGRFRTLRSEGNRNNEIGLPLTVLELGPEHEAAVLEMGMYAGGEIRDLAAIAQPAIGVVTAVQPVHLSRLGSIEAIADAKAELVEALPAAAADGVAVLNADDVRVRAMAARTRARPLSYGFAADADVRAEAVESRGFAGMRFRLVTPAGARPVEISRPGRLAVHNALAAAAVGLGAGMGLDEIVPGLAVGGAAPHRSVLLRAGGVVIVDDSYNASPGSVAAALELLDGLPGRRVAILGHMMELGEASAEGHASVGIAAAAAADLLIVAAGEVGGEAAGIADAALGAGMPAARVVRAVGRGAALEAALERLRPGDVVLVKGSQGIGLEEAVRDRLGVGLEVLVDELVDRLNGAPGPGSSA
jgi:UDP-N-acetylmuramoyl-tripeptide--D-alanyl-D-alanine ligase